MKWEKADTYRDSYISMSKAEMKMKDAEQSSRDIIENFMAEDSHKYIPTFEKYIPK